MPSGLVGGRRPGQVHRPGPALAAVQHVEADVAWRSGRATSAGPTRPSNRSMLRQARTMRLLHRVLGLERRAEHAVAVPGQLDPVLLELRLDRGIWRRMNTHADSVARQPSTASPCSGPSSRVAAPRDVVEPHQSVRERHVRAAALELLLGDRPPRSGRRRRAGSPSTSSTGALEVLGPQLAAACARASSGSWVTTFTSVSLKSECSLRLAEPTVSQRSSTIPTFACT